MTRQSLPHDDGRRPPIGWRAPGRSLAAYWMSPFVVILLTLAACGGPSTPSSGEVASGDFKIVAYQGEAVLGGKETQFLKVFEQGKPVVLNFFAGNCPPCRAEMPGFQQVSTAYAGKVIFVGVDVGPFTGLGSHEDAQRLLKQLGIRYPAAYAVDASPLTLYTVQSMPTTVVFDAKRQVVQKASGTLSESQLRSIIQKMLAAPS